MARADDFNNLSNEVATMYHARSTQINQIKNEINQVKNETLSLLAEFNARGQERTKEVKDLQAATQAML
ncbi:MAG: hypothetical protein WBC20_13215, partial [Candidatus Aminicenantaceae bacterium]